MRKSKPISEDRVTVNEKTPFKILKHENSRYIEITWMDDIEELNHKLFVKLSIKVNDAVCRSEVISLKRFRKKYFINGERIPIPPDCSLAIINVGFKIDDEFIKHKSEESLCEFSFELGYKVFKT